MDENRPIWAAMGAILVVLSGPPAWAEGAISARRGPDPILIGMPAPPGPCQMPAGADYLAGVDVYGDPVVPADMAGSEIHVEMATEVVDPEVLVHRPNLDRVRVHVAVRGLKDLLDPKANCLPVDASRPQP